MTDTQAPQVQQQNNKLLTAVAVSLVLGATAGYYMKDHNVFAKPGESGGSSVDEARVEEIVKKVIEDNPDLIMTSLQNMQKKAYEKNMKKAADGLKEHKDDLFKSKYSPVVGPKDAKITLVEFFDYHCGYCKKVAPAFKQALEENKDVKVIFKEFPILSPDSRKAAEAALAFNKLKPESYFAYHQALMDHRSAYTEEALLGYAKKLGVNGDALKKEMSADWVQKELADVADLAGKLGVQGTPGIIIGDELIPGAMEYDAMKFRIKAARELAK